MANLKDLIVTGPARFLNKIYGDLEGNATSADKWKTARTFSISNIAGTGSTSVDGSSSGGYTLVIPNTISGFNSISTTSLTATGTITATTFSGALSGNASSATIASYALKMQTYKYDSTTETYGTSYPLYAQWNQQGNIVLLKCDNYTVNTDTATKLATARTISLTGSVTGSGSFDGSGNLTINTTTNHTHSYLPLSGGTMAGTAFITWPDSGNWSNSNSGITFPVKRGGLQWVGQSDNIQIFSEETSNDNLNLICQFADDGSPSLIFRTTDGSQVSKISSDGTITANSFIGNASSATKLATARTINGTSFDGTVNITTANWGTSRTLTIGNTGKSVNGSGNVAWSIAEIGAVNKAGDTMTGTLLFSGIKTDNWTEGIRINDATNGWTTFCLGGTDSSGCSNATWSFHTFQNQFYLAHGGSSSSDIGILTSDENGNWQIKNTLGVNGKNINYNLYVNGSSNITGNLKLDGSITNLAINGGIYWNPYVESASDPSDAASITVIKSGVAGGTELRISQANDANDIVNISVPTNDAARINNNIILNAINYTNYTVTKTGSGASGTWGISITGNAATATKIGTATIGNSTKPIYLNAGTPTTFSTTVGNSLTPVYMNAGTITQGETFGNRVYDYNNSRIYYYSFGGGQDKNWKKIFAASHSSATPTYSDYRGCTVKGTIYYFTGNFDQAEVLEYPFQVNMTFYAGTSVVNSCILRVAAGCPDTIIRVVRVTTNSFELQVRQPADWQKIAIQFSYSGSATTQQAFSPVDATNTSVIAFSRLTTSRYISDSNNGADITITYAKDGQSSTSWFASWNGYELGTISTTNARNAMSAMGLVLANDFYGMAQPDGNTSVWIRTPLHGIIPYQTGGASSLGANGWSFNSAYINTVYGNLSGNASTATAFNSNRTIALTGAITGIASTNGASGWSITTTIAEKGITPTNITTNFRTQTKGNANAGAYLSVIRSDSTDSCGYMPIYGSGIAFGRSDTQTYLYTDYNSASAFIGGGNGNQLNWVKRIAFTDGTGAYGSWGINITGTAGWASLLNLNSSISYTRNSFQYFNIYGTAGAAVGANDTPTTQWWHILRHIHSNANGFYTDVAIPFNDNNIYYKRVANGSLMNGGWVMLYDTTNLVYSSTAPSSPKTGTIWLKPI